MDTEPSLPHDMAFSVLSSTASVLAPRVGKLALVGRNSISTPHYVPLTSRGAVPHVAHDVLRKETTINSLHIGLEDYDMPLIFGARRFPSIPCPTTNTETSISIMTSVGFRQLEAHQYLDAVLKLKPDIIIGLADLVLGAPPGVKRRGKMVDRTHAYTRDALDKLYGASVAEGEKSKAAYFAPVLPLDNTQQSLYLDDLASEFRDRLSGLALYESASLTFIPESVGDLPRLVLSEPSSPHDVLRDVTLGADLVTVPFMGKSSDAGIALDFTFPAPSSVHERGEPQQLGIDLWSPEYKKDAVPLSEGCECYACRNHHRAYLNHLLAAKEMAAWALLQIHNHHVMDLFFAGVRDSIQRGTFEADVQAFGRAYVAMLPETTGEGPRLRGHQLPAAGPNQPRRMPKIYGRLDDVQKKFVESQSSIATPDTDAEGLEKHGFAEKA